MKAKICSKCGEEKSIDNFRKDITKKDGYRPECKVCVCKFEKLVRDSNPEKIKKRLEKFYISNPDKRKEYRENYKQRKHEQRKERRKKDPVFSLINNMRSRLYKYLTKMVITKKNKTFEIVGCSPSELKSYLEKQFLIGMSWENRNEWHIDHIIPLSSARTEDELYKLCHYTNLQPLWLIDNIQKSNKILSNNIKSDL